MRIDGRNRGSLDRALIALVQEPERRRDDLEAVLAAAPAHLGRVVIDHGMAGVAYRHAHHLTDRFATLIAELNRARAEAWSRHLVMMADLQVVRDALEGLGGPWALVKGPVLALRAYGAPDLRRYLDLDLLVHPGAYGEALDRLEGAGAVLLDCNWELIGASMRAELSLLINGRTPIDLHWHLLGERNWRTRTQWDMRALLERVTHADIGGGRVPVLEPTDAQMHLAIHACLSGAHRMIWLKDLERHSAAFPVPAEQLESRAREARLWPHVSLALQRAAATFDLPEPRHLPAWTQLNRALGCGRFRAEHGSFGTGRTLAAATRPTLLGSVAATVADAGEYGLAMRTERRARRHHEPPPRPQWESLRTPAGTMADRRAYLSRVAAT